jgi:putative hydrolase of the HAD superfamily
VLFDYGGTLFKAKRPWSEVRAEGLASAHALLRRSGLTMSVERFSEFGHATYARYSEIEAREDRDIADRIKYQEMVDSLLPELPKARRGRLASEATRAFWETATRNYLLRESARRALKDLASAGLRMGVVSNHHDYDSLVGHLAESGIDSHFEVILASEREGVRKPNTVIFERSLRALKVKREYAIFVGDSPRHDIVGAKSAGIVTVLIDDGEKKDSWFTSVESSGPKGKPDYVIRDLLELRGIVDSLGWTSDNLPGASVKSRKKRARPGNRKDSIVN